MVTFQQIDADLKEYFPRLQKTGLPLARSLLGKRERETREYASLLKEVCNRDLGYVPDFKDPKDWDRVFYRDTGTHLPTTPSGLPQTSQAVIEPRKKLSPNLDLFQRGRQAQKLHQQIKGLLDLDKGHCPSSPESFPDCFYVFPQYSFNKESRNILTRNPNTGTWKSEVKEAVVSGPGLLALVYYRNLEIQILAHLSGDPVLAMDVEDGYPFENVAKRILKIESPAKEEVKLARLVFFVLSNGISPLDFFQNLQIQESIIGLVTKEKIESIFEKFVSHYSVACDYLKLHEKHPDFQQTTLFGRRTANPNYRMFGVVESSLDIAKMGCARVLEDGRLDLLGVQPVALLNGFLLLQIPGRSSVLDIQGYLREDLMSAFTDVRLNPAIVTGSNWHECERELNHISSEPVE